MKKTGIVDYNSAWPSQFLDLKAVYTHTLGNYALSIEHIGSTSFHGLAAKPILDIDIIVADEAGLNRCTEILHSLEHRFAGD